MEEPHAEADEKKTDHGIVPSTMAAKGVEEQQVAKDDEAKPTAKGPNAAYLAWQWVCKSLRNIWEFVKAPESTNVAIALATIVIAVATIYTYLEIHGEGVDTRKMAEVAVIQNRPWIGFEPGGMRSEPLRVDNRGWVTTVVSDTVKNFGNVPGLIPAAPGSVSAHLVVADLAHGNDVVVRQLREYMASQLPRGEGMSATIFPGMTSNYSNTAGVPAEQIIPDPRTADLEAFLVGGIVYTDPIGRVHHTAFSYIYWNPPFRGVLIDPTPGTIVPTGIWVEYRTLVD